MGQESYAKARSAVYFNADWPCVFVHYNVDREHYPSPFYDSASKILLVPEEMAAITSDCVFTFIRSFRAIHYYKRKLESIFKAFKSGEMWLTHKPNWLLVENLQSCFTKMDDTILKAQPSLTLVGWAVSASPSLPTKRKITHQIIFRQWCIT